MKRVVLAAVTTVMLAGCSTGVVPAGPQTYLISSEEVGLGNGGRAKAKIYTQADAWCRQRGLVMVPVSTDQHAVQVGGRYAGAELTFRALPPGDPEIKRSNVEKPDYTQRVEVR